VMILLGFAGMMQSCEEDAPTFAHSASDLEDYWQWDTKEGDGGYFQVSIKQISDSEFSIVNFHNLDGEEMKVSISGSSLSFSGELVDGNVVISNGTGNITNGWITMTLEYDCTTDGETEHLKVQLDKGKVISKSAKASGNQTKTL